MKDLNSILNLLEEQILASLKLMAKSKIADERKSHADATLSLVKSIEAFSEMFLGFNNYEEDEDDYDDDDDFDLGPFKLR